MAAASEGLFVKRWQHIAIDAADAFVVIAAAVVPEAVVVIEGDVTVGDEFVGDFLEVVGKSWADSVGNEARDAEAELFRLVRADVSAPSTDVRYAIDNEFTINREPAVGDH